MITMVPAASPVSRTLDSIRILLGSERSDTFAPEHHIDLDGWRGGLNEVPKRVTTSNDGSQQRLTKLLLNVNMNKSLGPLHVVMQSDNTVDDLIKAAIGIYVKEKRRPLLKETDPKFYQLHLSPYILESLKPDEKLISLGSRNLFMYLKPGYSVTSSSSSCASKERKMASSKSKFTFMGYSSFFHGMNL